MSDKDLFQKARGAAYAFRLIFGVIQPRLEAKCPDLLLMPHWRELFLVYVSVGGCTALALRLHFDREEAERSPLEMAMREGLRSHFSFIDTEKIWTDCYRFVMAKAAAMPREERGPKAFEVIASWVLHACSGGELTDDDLTKAKPIVEEIATLYQNETSGFWKT